MCYHKYTHYRCCTVHVPMHTHMCPKNVNEDLSRVIFCEDYQAIRQSSDAACPHCPPAEVTTPVSTSTSVRQAYPTPPKTGTPSSTR